MLTRLILIITAILFTAGSVFAIFLFFQDYTNIFVPEFLDCVYIVAPLVMYVFYEFWLNHSEIL